MIANNQDDIQIDFNQLSFGQPFVADGNESLGGMMNCTTDGPSRIYGRLETAAEGDPGTLEEEVETALGVARAIVEQHNLTDGNGRSALYSMYFHLANRGFSLDLEPKYVHAAWLSESEDGCCDAQKMALLLQCFSSDANDEIGEYLATVREQLESLQDVRESLKERWQAHETAWIEDNYESYQEKYPNNGGAIAPSEVDVLVQGMPGDDDAELDFWKRMHCYRNGLAEEALAEELAPLNEGNDGYDERLEDCYAEARGYENDYSASREAFMETLTPEALKDMARG